MAAGGGAVLLSWQPAAAAAGYAVLRAAGSGHFAPLGTTAQTSFGDVAPPAGGAHYKIVPFNAGGQGDASAEVSGDGEGPAVRVESATTFVSDTGEATVADDLSPASGATWTLYVPEPDGSFTAVQGQGTADGHMIFVGVAPGARYLMARTSATLSTMVLVGSARLVDLGSVWMGRPDNVRTKATTPTGVSLSATGLVPWSNTTQEGDDWLEVWSTGGATEMISYGPLRDGATTTAALPFTEDLWNPTLIEGAKGDVTWVGQGALRASPTGLPYSSIQRSWHGTSLNMQDGRLVPFAVDLSPTPEQHLTLRLNRSAFNAYAQDVSPQTPATPWAIVLAATQPSGDKYGVFSFGPSLFWAQRTFGTTDLDYGEIGYGDPYPAAWQRVGYAQVNFKVTITAPGATAPIPFRYSIMEVQDEVSKWNAGPLMPAVSPPLALRLGGRDARSGPLASVGMTPEVSWSPPRLGAPTSYDVHVSRVWASDTGVTQAKQVVWLRTQQSPVRIPPGVLKTGEAYYLHVTARLNPGQDIERAPNRDTTVKASATAVSAVFTP